MAHDRTADLIASWAANAPGWTTAVRERHIESRKVATDSAIVEAVLAHKPRRVLDIGCGEGWLVRVLMQSGVEAIGVDGAAPLVMAARAEGGGIFYQTSYAEMTVKPRQFGDGFDTVVLNFSLLEEHSSALLAALRSALSPSGVLIIQTVHPWTARAGEPYENAWRIESFSSFGSKFPRPMPWYYRTLGSWIALLYESGYSIKRLQEPMHPDTGKPLSLLFICVP